MHAGRKPPATPLDLATARLAPLVAIGLLGGREALDAVMEIALERCSWTPGHLLEIEGWLKRSLSREVRAWRQRPAAGDAIKVRRHAAVAQFGAAAARRHGKRL